MFSDRLAGVLRDRRKHLKLTQAQVAERAGVNHAYISVIEKGVETLTLRTLARVVDALDADLLFEVVPREAVAGPPPLSNEDYEVIDAFRAAHPDAHRGALAILRAWNHLDPAHRATLMGLLELWGVFEYSAQELPGESRKAQ